jgi:hypothetical protein
MPENYGKLFQGLLTWLGQTFNEEIANQTAAELERMKVKYLENPNNQGGTEASEPEPGEQVQQSKEFQELQRKLEVLERDNREMKFSEYFKTQSGRLVPAQKQLVKLAFDAVRDSEGYEFSEGGKTMKLGGEEVIKRLIESFPQQVEFSEIARKDRYEDQSDLSGQNESIDEFNKSRFGGK